VVQKGDLERERGRENGRDGSSIFGPPPFVFRGPTRKTPKICWGFSFFQVFGQEPVYLFRGSLALPTRATRHMQRIFWCSCRQGSQSETITRQFIATAQELIRLSKI